MSTVLPKSEAFRKAVKWISEQLKDNPQARPQAFINQAISKFDLSPKDSDKLIHFYKNER
ncbi:MAG: hypothetical protein GF313_00150 [Caldithrix sp.]|nr:hypothetical protein [Caldithrix sp.]